MPPRPRCLPARPAPQQLTPPITSLDDFEALDVAMDGMRHLSVSVREHMSFEREALQRASLEDFPPPTTSEEGEGSYDEVEEEEGPSGGAGGAGGGQFGSPP